MLADKPVSDTLMEILRARASAVGHSAGSGGLHRRSQGISDEGVSRLVVRNGVLPKCEIMTVQGRLLFHTIRRASPENDCVENTRRLLPVPQRGKDELVCQARDRFLPVAHRPATSAANASPPQQLIGALVLLSDRNSVPAEFSRIARLP